MNMELEFSTNKYFGSGSGNIPKIQNQKVTYFLFKDLEHSFIVVATPVRTDDEECGTFSLTC